MTLLIAVLLAADYCLSKVNTDCYPPVIDSVTGLRLLGLLY